MQSMNNAIKNNRSLLKGKTSYKNEDSFKGLRENKTPIKKTKFRKATKEELELISKRNKKQDAENLRIYIISGITLTLVIIGIIYFIFGNKGVEKSPAEIKLEENKRTYYSLLNIADTTASRKDWKRAIEIYEQLTEILPEKYVGHHRLIWAYIQNCRMNNENCFEAEKHIDKIKPLFPEKESEIEDWEIELKSLANNG